MSLMIVAKNKDITPWIRSFKMFDETIDIQIYPDIKNPDDITFSLVWSKNNIDFTKFKNLKCISSMGAGVDHILCNKTISKDIAVTKIVDEKLVDSMWEYLLSCVMNIITNQYKYINQQSKSIWKPQEARTISNTTIGIMGIGQLGSAMAQNFSKMNFKVKGYSNSKKDIENIDTFVSLEPFLKDVDILINLLPLTNDTKGILDYKLFTQLNSKAYLINVGRGEHLNEEDLIKALHGDILEGAVLDVFFNEPLDSTHPFWQNENIIITPHSASITNPKSVTTQIMENYKRVQHGTEVLHCIDRESGY